MRTCSAISLNENYVHTLDRTYPCKINAIGLYKMSAININSFTVLWKPLSPSWMLCVKHPHSSIRIRTCPQALLLWDKQGNGFTTCQHLAGNNPSLCLHLLADTANPSLLYKQAEPCISPLTVWCSPEGSVVSLAEGWEIGTTGYNWSPRSLR